MQFQNKDIWYNYIGGNAMKKMLVSDFDGTLYINKTINENDKKALKKIDVFVLATGRTYEELNKVNTLEPTYTITDQGAIIFKGKKIISSTTINNQTKDAIISLAKKYTSKENITFSKGVKKKKNLSTKDINKIKIKFDDKNLRNEVLEIITKNFKVACYKTKSHDKSGLEIVENKVNKAKAIEIIAKIENIEKENIYTIGDNYNDIEMINKYNGYIMKSAKKEIKEMCKNEIESISKLIEKIIK